MSDNRARGKKGKEGEGEGVEVLNWADQEDYTEDKKENNKVEGGGGIVYVEDGDEEELERLKERAEEEQKPFTRICTFFNSSRGCKKGGECDFLHERQVCAYYQSPKGCNRGEMCNYVHDRTRKPSVTLRQCPNDGCHAMCMGRQCSDCHRKRFGGGRGRGHHHRYSADLHLCPECNINQCRGRRCRGCHFKDRDVRFGRPFDSPY